MAANQLELTNIVNISVATSQAGVGAFNTSNLAIFTDEVPANSFGTAGYALYLSPTQVGTDFGTTSKTYKMANAIFSQQPNILAGNGYLCIITMTVAIQHIVPSGTPASGTFKLNYGATATGFLNWNDSAAVVQAALRLISGLEEVTVTGTIAAALDIKFAGVYGVQSLLTVSNNTVQTSAPASVTFTVTTTTAGETLDAAITRTKDLVQYFGITVDETVAQLGQADLLAAAAVVQALNKIAFFVSYTEADILTGGMIDLLRSGGFTQSRGLYYGDNTSGTSAKVAVVIVMMASYAGRALSTNFSGSNTTSTMHLKDLTGVQPDPTMTQTILTEALAAGADTYVSLQGVAKVFCSGLNSFYDQVYNLQWFVGTLQVAIFNYLAQSSTKIPQTENGMDGLKGSIRQVCTQAVTCQYFAPGKWNSSTTFGVQDDFLKNITQVGYYIYSVPVSQQSQTDRAARKAPLCQIAGKEAGAIQSATVIVNINA